MFLNNEEVVDINEAINVKDGDNLILVRFVILQEVAFRMFSKRVYVFNIVS